MHFVRSQAILSPTFLESSWQNVCKLSTTFVRCFEINKAVEIGAVKKSCEMKVITAISQAKIWDPFRSGKHVRDLYAELLVPKHVTKAWQRGVELRALK